MAAEGILQLHVTRHCNLACSHCYSSSGPREKGGLPFDRLPELFATALDEGYGVLSLSGGEPLMDPRLFEQIDLARSVGLRVNVVTNGGLVREREAEQLAARTNIVAVSLDGPPEVHNALRGSPLAFAHAVRGIGRLRAAGARVAIIHTARAASLPHLRWLVRFAGELGAEALQLHPLEPTGRARLTLGREFRQADLATRLALLAAVVGRDEPGPPIHVDVLPLGDLPRAPATLEPGAPLAAIIDQLIVEPDGALSPWTYGIDRRLALGDLRREPLRTAIDRYRAGGLELALAHREDVRIRLQAGHPWPFVSWYAQLAARPPVVGISGVEASNDALPQRVAGRLRPAQSTTKARIARASSGSRTSLKLAMPPPR